MSKDATRDHIKQVARKGEEKEIFRINSRNETIDVNRFNIIYILRLSHFGGFCCILTTTRAENFMLFFMLMLLKLSDIKRLLTSFKQSSQ